MAQTVNPQTQTENVMAGQGARMGVRAEAYRLKNAAINQANNTGANNSLARQSSYQAYQQNPGNLAAFHPAPQIGPTPSGAPMGQVNPYGPTTPTAPGKLVPQGVSDALFGRVPTAAESIAGTGRTAMTPYGPISSHDPTDMNYGKAVETPTGVSHFGGFNSQDEQGSARTQLLSDHPEIGQAGTAANQAFVAYAQQHGEQAAHNNIASILAGGTDLNPNGSNSATAIPSGAPSPNAPKNGMPYNYPTLAEGKPSTPAQAPVEAGLTPGSPLAQAAGTLSNLPVNAYGVVQGVENALGENPLLKNSPADPRVANVRPGAGKATARALGVGTPNYVNAYQ